MRHGRHGGYETPRFHGQGLAVGRDGHAVCSIRSHEDDARTGRSAPPSTLVGDHLYDVKATTADGQTAQAVVAADDEWAARTGLMLVQTTMKLRGQVVVFVVQKRCPHKRSHAVDIDGVGESWRYCNDCHENFTTGKS